MFPHPWLWLLIGQALLYHLFYGGAQTVLGPIVIGDEFGRSSWGIAMAVLMSGFVVGGLVCLRWRPRRSLLLGTLLLSLTAALPDRDGGLRPARGGPGRRLPARVRSPDLRRLLGPVDPAERRADDKLSRVYSFDLVGSFVARPLGLALTGPIAARSAP